MTMQTSDLETSGVGLRHYLAVLRRRKWIVVGIVAIATAASLAFSLSQQSIYRAQTKIVIGQGNSLFQPQFGNQQQSFTATMSDLIQSNIVASRVIQTLHLDVTPQALLGRMVVSINPETAVLKLNVDDHDPEQANRIAHQIGLSFSQLVSERFGGAASGSGANVSAPLTATIFDPAHILPGRVAPRTKRNVVIAVILGLVLGLIAAFVREYFDRALRTRDDVEGAFGLPVIGQLPFEKQHRNDTRTVTWGAHGEIAEAYRSLRANLQYLAVSRPLRTILVTSAAPEQGKTTVAANLALAIARSGASTVVIDADLRRPRIEAAFGIRDGAPGLTTVLVGNAQLEDILREIPLEAETATARRLAVVPSGPLPPNPTELLSSAQMESVLDQLAARFDYVVIDSPPLLLVADALELARVVDGVVLCVRRNRATSDEARELRPDVERLGIHLVGAVLTDVEPVGSYGAYGEPARPAVESPASVPVVSEEV